MKWIGKKEEKFSSKPLEMKDYLGLEEEKVKKRKKLEQKKKRLIAIGSSCILLLVCIAIGIPLLFPSPYKGNFAYVKGVGVVEGTDLVYEWNGEAENYTIDAKEGITVTVESGAKKIEQEKTEGVEEWREDNVFFIKIHVPWNGEKVTKTGWYSMEELQSEESLTKDEIELNPKMEEQYPKELLLTILQYKNLNIRFVSRGTSSYGYGYSNHGVEIKEKEFVLDYEVSTDRYLYAQESVKIEEAFWLQLSLDFTVPSEYINSTMEWNREMIGSCSIKGVWEHPKTVDDIRELGEVTSFYKNLIFSKEEALSEDGMANGLEVQTITRKGEEKALSLSAYKHTYGLMIDGDPFMKPYYLEKDGEKLDISLDYGGVPERINFLYSTKDIKPDSLVIPYVFEEKSSKKRKIVKLPVPKEDGSFEGNYSFQWKENGADTTIKIKKAIWNMPELVEIGYEDILCYELEIEENGDKKELESMHFQEEDEEVKAFDGSYSYYTSLYSDIVWTEDETPYLVIMPMNEERLEGKTEWELAITKTVYRYKEPLKIPLKNH